MPINRSRDLQGGDSGSFVKALCGTEKGRVQHQSGILDVSLYFM